MGLKAGSQPAFARVSTSSLDCRGAWAMICNFKDLWRSFHLTGQKQKKSTLFQERLRTFAFTPTFLFPSKHCMQGWSQNAISTRLECVPPAILISGKRHKIPLIPIKEAQDLEQYTENDFFSCLFLKYLPPPMRGCRVQFRPFAFGVEGD